LDQVQNELKQEFERAGKGNQFKTLSAFLMEEEAPSYAKAAEALKISEGAARVAAHRLRRRYGTLLRAALAHTVSNPDEIDDEIRFLHGALNG
jgi:RNA polymerase sigma-70 factor (ECF subfamily)